MYSGRIQGVGLSFRLALGECCHRFVAAGVFEFHKRCCSVRTHPFATAQSAKLQQRTNIPPTGESFMGNEYRFIRM